MSMQGKNIAVGIDLGTTFSCVAYYENDKVEIIENNNTGLRTTPSVVTFTNDDRIIGKPAKISENTVFEVKRLIGRKFDDEIVQSDIKKWPFQVVNVDTKPNIKVTFKGKQEILHPEQISAMVLSKMKEIASLHLNQDIKQAVITVPAYFNDSQRQATKDAAAIAGLEVLRIINEPTAAAIAYGYHKKIYKKSNILIYDLGGGTFDVSIMEIDDGNFKVLSINGDTHLGGVDFDNRLLTHLAETYKKKYDKDFTNDKRAMHRLRTQCEIAKRALSEAVETTIEIDAFYDGEDYTESISRALFEELNDDLFNKTIDIVKTVLTDSKLEKSDISEIVLIGGSIRIPKIQSLLKDFFDGKQIKRDINPDEAVAYGAAIQAAILSENNFPELNGITIVDVTPLSLGIEIQGGLMSNLIPRNTNTPTTRSGIYSTIKDDQENIRIAIFEGERLLVKDNYLLGEFVLNDIKKAAAGVPKIEVTFSIDNDGILHVTAKDKDTLSLNEIKITNTKGHLSESEILKMITDSEKWLEDDRKQKEKIEAKNALVSKCYKVKNAIKNNSHCSAFQKKRVEDFIDDSLKWIDAFNSLSIQDIKKKLDDLKDLETNSLS